jgi:hypothetical protein
VLGWKNLERSTKWKHRVDLGGIAASYQLTKTTKVRCTLKHEHARGAIVVTRCGLTLLLGWKCAQNAVHGAEALQRYVKELEAHMTKIDRVKRVPGECLDKLIQVCDRLEQAQRFKNARWDTAFGREMRRRATSGSARAAEVTYKVRVLDNQKATDLGAPNVRLVDHTESILGLPFWTTDLGLELAQRTLEQVKALVADARHFNAEDEDLLEELNRRTITLESLTTKSAQHVELCGLFLGQGNLRLAGRAVVESTSAESTP